MGLIIAVVNQCFCNTVPTGHPCGGRSAGIDIYCTLKIGIIIILGPPNIPTGGRQCDAGLALQCCDLSYPISILIKTINQNILFVIRIRAADTHNIRNADRRENTFGTIGVFTPTLPNILGSCGNINIVIYPEFCDVVVPGDTPLRNRHWPIHLGLTQILSPDRSGHPENQKN